MRRPIARSALIGVLSLASCVSGSDPPPASPATGPSAIGPTATGSVTESPPPTGTATESPSPDPEPDLQLPADAPTSVDDPAVVDLIEAGDHSALIPPGAEDTIAIEQARPTDPIDQIAVAWRRGTDPFAPEVGLVVWQRFEQGPAPTWRAVYAFTDRPRAGVLGLRVSPAELTGDGIDDLLTQEQLGGTGACATWRVITSAAGSASEIFRRGGCDTVISAAAGTLEIREAVYEPGDPHCCPSAYRTTVLAWEGHEWVELSSELERAS